MFGTTLGANMRLMYHQKEVVASVRTLGVILRLHTEARRHATIVGGVVVGVVAGAEDRAEARGTQQVRRTCPIVPIELLMTILLVLASACVIGVQRNLRTFRIVRTSRISAILSCTP